MRDPLAFDGCSKRLVLEKQGRVIGGEMRPFEIEAASISVSGSLGSPKITQVSAADVFAVGSVRINSS